MAKPAFSVSFRTTAFGGYVADLGEHMLDSERVLAGRILIACEVYWNGVGRCFSTADLRRADVAYNALRQYGISVIPGEIVFSNRPEEAIPLMQHIRANAFARELDQMKDLADRERARRFTKNRRDDDGPQIQAVDVDEAFRT